MYDNRKWLWQYQDKPVVKTIYDGLYNIVGSVSTLPILDLIDIDKLNGAGLVQLASIYNIPVIGGIITDAFTWNVSKWNDEKKFWNGKTGEQDNEFFKRYIKMKMTVFGRQLSIATIKECLDILLGDLYICDIIENESSYSFEIRVTISEGPLRDVFLTALAIDPFMFGKPSGYSYTINVE